MLVCKINLHMLTVISAKYYGLPGESVEVLQLATS